MFFALGVVAVGTGTWLFVWLGLNKGNQVAGVLSFFVGAAGLIVSIAGVVTARRSPAGQSRPAQSITDSSFGGSAEVIRNVGGSVTSRRGSVSAVPAPPSSASPSAAGADLAEQNIVNSRIPGSARYYDNITGDIETEG